MENLEIFDLDFCQDNSQEVTTQSIVGSGWTAPTVGTSVSTGVATDVSTSYFVSYGPKGYVAGGAAAGAAAGASAAAVTLNGKPYTSVSVGANGRT
jgi:hypothetical protein